MSSEFDLRDLYDAVDAQRQSGGLTWARVAREIGVSASTLRAIKERNTVEGDGVLQVLGWLQRSPESFLRGGVRHGGSAFAAAAESGVLRFDTRGIYAALDARRAERGMTWRQVASAIGVGSATSLTRLRDGGRVCFPEIMRVFGWLGEPAVRFVRIARR